ncbi:hypothetical protein [Streptomyces sp. NPDC007007]|uniref:hypothetical protein n=1 Tax=Streptomyces sp. NPDC007007 TaxID=3364770 RepID=UPI00367E373E
MVNRSHSSVPVWHRLAQPNDQLRALAGRTRWVACGRAWGAVAISPMALGLEALLYVLVPPGTGPAAAGLPGVRVLGAGTQLLMPTTEHGTLVAHWVSPPGTASVPLVRPDRLAHQLRVLTSATGKAEAS